MMGGKIVGIDIGGTNFRIGTVDSDGTVSGFRKIPVGQVFHTDDPMADLTGYLKDYCQAVSIQAISIGFPATLDRNRQTVLQAPNVPFMENMPVVRVLSKKMNVPVFIERDVTMALYYDQVKYKIPKCEVVCGYYFGTGIGNAISINGTPLLGRNGTAGELGHIPVDGSEVLCGCGNVGCMESLAGGRYLAHLCHTVYSGTAVEKLFLEHGDAPAILQFVDRMAMAVATEVNILNPDYILLGGGVPGMAGFPKAYLQERIFFHTRKPYPANDLNLIFTEDEEDKCVIGAAWYAISKNSQRRSDQ